MSRIIIENRSDLNITHAMELVEAVINNGRISNSNKQYCYATTFTVLGKKYAVTTFLNEKSDKFDVFNQ